jgi:hypothetical protein
MGSTTGNISEERYTFSNLADGTILYLPGATGTNGDGFDHMTFRVQIVSGNVGNTVTATVQSDDGVTGTFAWDETLGLWNWMTGTYGTAGFVANNSTTRCRLLAINHNARLWRVKITVAIVAANADNSGIIEIRKVKV